MPLSTVRALPTSPASTQRKATLSFLSARTTLLTCGHRKDGVGRRGGTNPVPSNAAGKPLDKPYPDVFMPFSRILEVVYLTFEAEESEGEGL